MRDTKTKSKSKKKKTFSKKQIHEAIQKWSKVLEMMNEKGQARWKNEVLFDFKKWERDDFPPDFFDFDGSEMDIG